MSSECVSSEWVSSEWEHAGQWYTNNLQSQFPTRPEETLYSSRDRRNEVWDQNREEFESNVSYPSSDCVPRTTWWNPIANPVRYDEKSDVRPVRSERNRNTKDEAAPETRSCTLPVLLLCMILKLNIWLQRLMIRTLKLFWSSEMGISPSKLPSIQRSPSFRYGTTVPVFEREARVKYFVTFEWYYCEWEIR